jgi:2,3-bisphosphoglycerate-independent phosphoglycerate mutase
MTSGVDLLKGLAKMADMEILQISGVTDGLDNNYTAQTEGALKALERNDLVILHIEAPDEMGHRGSIEDKVKAIELIDREVIGRIRTWRKIPLRVLVMPDHPTPIEIKTHCGDAVPFLIWGESVKSNGAVRFTEAEAGKTGAIIEPGYKIMGKLIKGG